MKVSVTLTFSALFLAVGTVYLYFKAVRTAVPSSEIAAAPARVPLVEGDPVEWIRIERQGDPKVITLAREGNRWMLKEPVVYEAEEPIVQGLAAALAVTTKAHPLVPEENWEAYGLEPPETKIGIRTREDRNTRTLALGAASPAGDAVFARWEDSREYFLLPADFSKAFERSLYSLRAKRILRTPPASVARFSVKMFRSEYEWVRRGEKWSWIKPATLFGKPVEEEMASDVLSHLFHLYVKDFLDGEKKSRTELGLVSSGIVIKLWGEKAVPEIVYLGREAAHLDAYYGYREGEEGYLLAARDNVRAFFESLEMVSLMAGKK